jgi:hypothetical protein
MYSARAKGATQDALSLLVAAFCRLAKSLSHSSANGMVGRGGGIRIHIPNFQASSAEGVTTRSPNQLLEIVRKALFQSVPREYTRVFPEPFRGGTLGGVLPRGRPNECKRLEKMHGYDPDSISAETRAPATQSGREESHHASRSRAFLAGDWQKARGWHGNGVSGRSGAFQNCSIIALGAFQNSRQSTLFDRLSWHCGVAPT